MGCPRLWPPGRRIRVTLVVGIVLLVVNQCAAQCEHSRVGVSLNECRYPEAALGSGEDGAPHVHIEFTSYLWTFPQVDQQTGRWSRQTVPLVFFSPCNVV